MSQQSGTDPRTWRGIFSIPPTPMDEQGDIDLDGLKRAVNFAVECGAHGIVHPVMASEFFTLSDAERLAMIPAVVDAVDGRCPVVIGVSGVCTQSAVTFASAANAAGADAVIAMPPYIQRYSDDDVLKHFEAIDKAAQVPIFIQNAAAWQPVSRDFILTLARQIEHVHFVKEEVPPAHHHIGHLNEAQEPEIWGIFGGAGCINLFGEMRRGAAGNMPASAFTDIFVRMFELYDAGDCQAADELHRRLMPLIERAGPQKELLVKRGVLTCSKSRAGEKPFDAQDRRERDANWAELEREFTWHA
ncbi:MAG TPA: dihydrodipicolinate synthase family protein [Thermomicrobiales bacterium]|nr:dihydrodipicolinate synthase family protein [Thermomicrobiales bacterium]